MVCRKEVLSQKVAYLCICSNAELILTSSGQIIRAGQMKVHICIPF